MAINVGMSKKERKMAKFNIDAVLHRRHGRAHTKVVWTRRYARIETAVRRCTEFLVLDGEVGDVIEFVLRINGWQVGTIRVKANGCMQVDWTHRKMIQQIQKEAELTAGE